MQYSVFCCNDAEAVAQDWTVEDKDLSSPIWNINSYNPNNFSQYKQSKSSI